MLSKLSCSSRSVLVITIIWCISVVSLACYERFVTIGDTSGPWALYGHYGSFVFHHVEINGNTFSFWLEKQRFYTTLLFGPFIAGLFAFGAMLMSWKNQPSSYLTEGCLADVLALIQVLALDEDAHRSEKGLMSELQRSPRSADNWLQIAERHPEFFRVAPAGEHQVSLVARHVNPRTDGVRPTLPSDYTAKLLQLAVELHDREVRRSQHWHVWIPLIVALTAGTFTIFGIWLKGAIGGP